MSDNGEVSLHPRRDRNMAFNSDWASATGRYVDMKDSLPDANVGDAGRAAADDRESEPASKTRLLVTMFLSAALAVSSVGCAGSNDRCYDTDGDGRCDDDGTSIGAYAGTSGGRFYYSRGGSSAGIDGSGNGVTSGAKGGIGSSHGFSSS